MAGFRDYEIDRYIRKIQDHGITSVVYEEYDTAKDGTKLRRLQGVYSPGTYIQDDDSQLSNNIMCIWVEEKTTRFTNKKIIGMTNIDIITGRTSLFEHVEDNDHNPTTYDEIERFHSVYYPSEVIIISNMEENKIDDIVSFANITPKTLHKISYEKEENIKNKIAKRCFLQNFQQEIIEKFFSLTISQSLFNSHSDSVYAMASMTYMLQFLAEHSPHLAEKLKEPIFENYNSRVILANHSLEQLNIIPKNIRGKCSSILTLLDNNITAIGKRRFKRNLLNPSYDGDFLEKEYDIGTYIQDHKELCTEWRKHMYDLKDLEKMYRFIISEKILPQSMPIIMINIESVQELFSHVLAEHDFLASYIDRPHGIDYCNIINQFLKNTFRIEICDSMSGTIDYSTVFIQKRQDEELDNLILKLNESQQDLDNIIYVYNNIVKSVDKNSKTTEYIKIHETEKGRITLHITKRRGILLKEALKNAEVSSEYKTLELIAATTSNSSLTNKYIDTLCNNISEFKKRIQERQEIVYKKILQSMKEFQQEFEAIIHIVGCLDNWQNLSMMNTKFSLCRPIIDNSTDVSYATMTDLYHPLIQALQQDEIYVANNLDLNSEQGPRGMLLYGTNAVGKTSYIKSVGIAIIMAQAGLFAPASHMIYKPYQNIMTRILGNDNIFKGLSTFAVEMIELRVILKMANQYSLILGDELCSGTEIDSAKSIFVSGLQWLYERNASFIFATHLHEIANYNEIQAMEKLVLKHLSVIYDSGSNALIYDRKLRDGPGESMYGLEVCKSLNLPSEFLSNAIELRNKYNSTSANHLLLNASTSQYNSQKIIGMCEMCNSQPAEHVHHLQHQKNANEKGFIGNTHKNHLGNLMSLCHDCHHKIHSGKNEQYAKRKTTSGKTVLKKVSS
jgi:DNA mismatch repair protein MutS